MIDRLVVASNNPGKLREFERLLALAAKGIGELVEAQRRALGIASA